jgi:hypothetical protein
MVLTASPIQRFFDEFTRRTNSPDASSQPSQFADVFLAAGLQGAKFVRVSDFAPAVEQRKQLFDKLGCQSTALVSLAETWLDGRYVLARTQWRMTFDSEHAGHEEIMVASTFLVDTGSDDYKILLYLAHQDIMQVLKDRGITAG